MAQHLQGWLQALAQIGGAVNRGVSLSELLDLIATTACKLLSYDFCAITIPDAASQVLVIEGSYGLSADYIREINETHPIRLHGVHTPTPSGQAYAMGVPVQIPDMGSNPTLLAWRAAAKDQGFTSMISVPLNSADETLGTLNCYTRSTHHFTKEEESRLLMLADQAAAAITTSRLRSEQADRITALNGLNESLEEQYELQRQAEAIHERLTVLTLEGGGVAALGGALAEILDRPVAVCDTKGTILYNTERDGVSLPAALLANAGSAASDTGVSLPDVMSAGTAGFLAEVHLPDTTGTRTVVRVPVIIKEKVVAWIWTSGKVSELRPLDRQAMERAAAPLALELLRSQGTEPAAALGEQISSSAGLGSGRITRLVDEVVDWLKGAEQLLDLGELERSVGLLRSAGRIHTWGLDMSGLPAKYAATRLTRLGLDAMTMESSGFKMADELLTVRKGHVVLLFVPGRHHSDIDVILDHAASVGASTILITGTLGPSARRRADAVLAAPTAPSKLTGEVFAGMLISDILVVELSAQLEEQATATNALLTQLRQNL